MESQDASQPIKYDESLLIMVKGKVQQPKQPEHAESRLLISKLQAEISKRADRIKEIKAIEEQIRGKAQGVASGNSEVIKELQGLRSKRAAILVSLMPRIHAFQILFVLRELVHTVHCSLLYPGLETQVSPLQGYGTHLLEANYKCKSAQACLLPFCYIH